ncbi:MAG: amidohydrolase family protein [Micromonosporaceae bacterium]
MIIDVHAHAGPWFFSMDVGDPALNLALMDRYGIDAAIVSASEAVTYDAVAGNRWLAEILPLSPRLFGYVVVNPTDLEAAERDLAHYLPGRRFMGVKIHTHYPARELSSSAMRDALRLVAAAGVPALVHTWAPDVHALVDVLEAEPELRVIAGHMGGPAWQDGVAAARRCDRLYLQPCGSITDRGKLRYALDRVPATQLMFGTDATLIDPVVALGVVADAGLDERERELVLWRNAARLFDLPHDHDRRDEA